MPQLLIVVSLLHGLNAPKGKHHVHVLGPARLVDEDITHLERALDELFNRLKSFIKSIAPTLVLFYIPRDVNMANLMLARINTATSEGVLLFAKVRVVTDSSEGVDERMCLIRVTGLKNSNVLLEEVSDRESLEALVARWTAGEELVTLDSVFI